MKLRIAPWLAAIVYGAMLVAGSHDGFPAASPTGSRMPYLADKPIGEDGYYMLTVAWSLAGGDGLVYNTDGVTTGIQPLSTFVFAGVAWLVRAFDGDRWAYARAMLAIGMLQWLAVAAVIIMLARQWLPRSFERRDDAVLIATALALGSYPLFRLGTYGLETPIYLVAMGCFIHLANRAADTKGAAWWCGVAAGTAALARIDFLLLLTIYLALEKWHGRISWRQAAAISGVTGIMVSPWFLFVYSVTGNLIPTSGRAQSVLPADWGTVAYRLDNMLGAIAQQFAPWLHLPAAYQVFGALPGDWPVSFLIGALALGAGVPLAVRGYRTLPPESAARIVSWGIALAAMAAVYTVSLASTHFYARYAAPIALVTIPMMSIGLAAVLRGRGRTIAFNCAVGASFAVVAWLTLHSGQLGNNHSVSAGYVARLLPPPAIVGAYQSGTLGFFNSNVVNLDGKVNARALEAKRAGRLREYVRERGLTHVVDWPPEDGGNWLPPFDSWPECGLGRFGASECRRAP